MSAPSGIAAWSGLSLVGRNGGPYRVVGVLAAGGMAFVLRATDAATNRGVVVKVPKPHLMADDTIAKRFAREVHALLSFRHPHVVPLLDHGTHDGLPFMVMPYLAGGTLTDRSTGPAPPAALRDWLGPVADALDAIHARGGLHRDVKPDNILFDAAGVPHLTDFGVVKGVGADGPLSGATVYTSDGGVLGTAPYMAPELLQGQRIDARTDQFALAATVFQVLAGRVPFEGTHIGAVMKSQLTLHLAKRRPPLAVPGVSPDLAAAVVRGLAFSPDDRYPNCRTLAAAVLKHLPEAPQPLPPPVPRSSPGTASSPTLSAGAADTRHQPPPRPPQPKPGPPPVVARPLPQPPAPPRPVEVAVDAPPPKPPEELPKGTRVKPGKLVEKGPLIPEDELPGSRPPRRGPWWVRTGSGAVLGPYSNARLRELLDTGKVREFDEVSWNNRDWAAAGSFSQFAEYFEPKHRGRRGSGGVPWWVWVVLAGGVAAAAAVAALFLLK